MARRSERRFSINMPDRSTTAVLMALAAIIIAAAFPRVYPVAQRGIECSDLAAPIGGNNRAIGSQPNDPGAISIKLEVVDSTITFGEGLNVRVTLVNDDNGPVILYVPERPPVLKRLDANNTPIPGITFEITRLDGSALIDQTTTAPITLPFPFEDLHLLGSRSRCTERFELNLTQLQQAGLTSGDYRIQAFYYNGTPGGPYQYNPREAPPITPTPYPGYANSQNVWVGEASSGEVRFSVTP